MRSNIKKINFLQWLLISLIIGMFVYFIGLNNNTPLENNAPQTENSEQAAEPVPAPDTSEILEQKIMAIVNKYPSYNIGVSVKSLNSNVSSNVNSSQAFIAASTTKTIVAAYTYAQADKGTLNMDDLFYPNDKPAEYMPKTFRENVRIMIEDSDNEAWTDLRNYFGYTNIQNFAKNAGASSFNSVENTITAADMSTFLTKLNNKPLITKDYLNELLEFMSNSWTGPLKLEPSLQSISKKAGWLRDRLHLVGFIGANDQKMSFSIYSETPTGESYNYTDGSALINDLLNTITANPI